MPLLSNYYPKINKMLEAAIMKCVEPNPDDRFQSMSQFLQAIKRVKHEDV
jgi:hypothetical protein